MCTTESKSESKSVHKGINFGFASDALTYIYICIYIYMYIYPRGPTPLRTKGFSRTPFVCHGGLAPKARFPGTPDFIFHHQPRLFAKRASKQL